MSKLHYLILPLATLFLISCGEEEAANTEPAGRTLDYIATVSFLTAAEDTVATIEAAVADDDESRSTGLMNVYDMPRDKGMLFIFDDEEPRSFWMANTPLALDIIFVNTEMEIIRIHQNTRPYSERNVESEQPAKYVVETNAGFTLRHDIIEGMKITYEL
jgi:uncharacterized membrane protein (UPF0127 family)